MTKLMQFVALIAVLGCVLPTTVTAQTWGPVRSCPRGQKAVGFQLWFENRPNRRLVAIVLICTRGSRIVSPPGPPPGTRGIPGAVQTCRPGRYLVSCRLQLERPGRNTPANNLSCRCNDGQILLGDGHPIGVWQPWSPRCPNGIVGLQTETRRRPNPFYIYGARFHCSRPMAEAEIEEVEEEVEEVEEEE
ncbi:vitelline membrane outer layer protein 1 homolog isoform X7 [Daphnia pulicaria]|uniref:vitelline membrane outer layer protein 1 homolog isoform X7 n=1 Tax=Daphnia pulicaria TaxID=35523 RepID=UPI001EEB9562|nr:vitelline membrane outer layer protein 1 homolog isoform X7 [Daphnia pulicaria]